MEGWLAASFFCVFGPPPIPKPVPVSLSGRLLLPFEYQLKGLSLSAPPQHQHRRCHPSDYGSYGNEGPIPAKHKMVSVPLHQVGVSTSAC